MSVRILRWRRWWHGVGVALFLLCLGGLPFYVPSLSFFPARLQSGIVLSAFVLPFAWALLVCPWLDSGVAAFTEDEPPSLRQRHMLVFAWTPLAILVGIAAALLMASIVQSWPARRLVLLDGLSSGWLWASAAALALHGKLFGRLLVSRSARAASLAAKRARICFSCGYSLAEIPNCERCPECGQAVESCDSSRPSGEAKDAVARS